MSRMTSKAADESLACAVLRAALGASVTINDVLFARRGYALLLQPGAPRVVGLHLGGWDLAR